MKLSHSYAKAYKICASVAAASTLAASAFLIAPLFRIGANAITPIDLNITSGEGYHLGYTSSAGSEGVKMNIAGSVEGTLASAKDTVSIDSNLPEGWNLYISSASDTNRRLHLNGDESSIYFVQPASGTHAAPAALSNNTYGYALAEAPFTTTENAYATPSPSTGSTWAAVPFLRNADLIKTGTESADVDVYYGAKIDMGLKTGHYTGNIMYTVMGSVADSESATISPESASPDTIIRVNTGLLTTRQITASDVEVYVDVSEVLEETPKLYCPIEGVSQEDGVLTISCRLPGVPLFGIKYDIVASVFPYGKVYRVRDFDVQDPILNLSATNINQITYMQEMNQTVCQSMITDETYNLKDSRDNKIYTISKFQDGSCWMTKNLNIGPASFSNRTISLKSSTSNVGADGGSIRLTTGDYNRNQVIGSGNYTIGSANSAVSVCPRGWRLPIPSEFPRIQSYSELFGTGRYWMANLLGYTFAGGGGMTSGWNSGEYFQLRCIAE